MTSDPLNDCPDCYGRPRGECPNCGARGVTRREAATERQRRFRERKYAEGKHYVRGYLTDAPRVMRSKGEEPPHGTIDRYRWSYGPCRCDECRAANTTYKRHWRERNRA